MTAPAPNPPAAPMEIGAVVPLREIYAEVLRSSGQLSSVLAQLQQIMREIENRDRANEGRFQRIEETFERIETEVDKLKERRWPLSSLAAIVGVIGIVLTAYSFLTK